MQTPSDLIRSHLYSNGIPTNDYLTVESFSHDSFRRIIQNAVRNEIEYPQPYSSLNVVTNGVTSHSDSLTLGDYFNIFSSLAPTEYSGDSSVIFPGIRHISDTLLIFERPPTMKPYSYLAAYRESISDETRREEFYIPIPWQVYICSFDPREMRLVNVKMLFANSSLSSFDDNVYAPPLLNFYSNGNLCRPFFESMDDIEKYPKNYSGIMASAYDWIWNSGTNFDITENISEFLRLKKYEQFHSYCAHNPNISSYYNLLANNNITSNPTALHYKLVKSYFTCLEQVPLEEIINFSWTNPTLEDFYYQENHNSLSTIIESFADEHNYIIHEHNFDYEEHDDDCPEECIYRDDVPHLDGYNQYYQDRMNVEPSPKDLRFCAVQSVYYLVRQGFYNSLTTQSEKNKIYSTALSVINR